MRRLSAIVSFVLLVSACATTASDESVRQSAGSCLDTPEGGTVHLDPDRTPVPERSDGLLVLSDLRAIEEFQRPACSYSLWFDAVLEAVIVGPSGVQLNRGRREFVEGLTAIDVPYEFGSQQADGFERVYALTRGTGSLTMSPPQPTAVVQLLGIDSDGGVTGLGDPATLPPGYFAAIAAQINDSDLYPAMTPEELVVAWMQAQAGTGAIPLDVFTSAEAATR